MTPNKRPHPPAYTNVHVRLTTEQFKKLYDLSCETNMSYNDIFRELIMKEQDFKQYINNKKYYN